MIEEWKPVISCGGVYSDRYEVSNFGYVRASISARIKGSKPGRILFQSHDDKGYCQVVLYNNYRAHTIKVHRLVADAFLGVKPEGLQVNHINGVKDDNSVANLEYVTNKENNLHAHRVIAGRSFVVVYGQRMSLAEACDKFGRPDVRPKDARRRIHRYGWTIERAITTPKQPAGRPRKTVEDGT